MSDEKKDPPTESVTATTLTTAQKIALATGMLVGDGGRVTHAAM